jgi:hypothetical protein
MKDVSISDAMSVRSTNLIRHNLTKVIVASWLANLLMFCYCFNLSTKTVDNSMDKINLIERAALLKDD